MLTKTYNNTKLSSIDPVQAARETAEYGIVVIRGSGASSEEFGEWVQCYGHHQMVDVWCTEDVFWRVTNERIDGNNMGLLGDAELDWHSDLIPVVDAEECVGLYARTITYPTETWVCNTRSYWQTLNLATCSYYSQLHIELHGDRYLPPSTPPRWDEMWDASVLDGIMENRNTRNYISDRGMPDQLRLVPKHPLGAEGLFFPVHEISGGITRQVFDTIWHDLQSHIYQHEWQEGDILFMDQLLTTHKRPSVDPSKIRELLRTTCWYDKSIRLHEDTAL